MASMRVILTEEISKLGEAGDVVTVKAGYGRNYLLPQGKAMLATDGRVNELDHKRRVIEEKEKKAVGYFEERAAQLSQLNLTFEVQASDEGKLFGSVTNADIAARLAEHGFDIERRRIQITEPIKQTGLHEAEVRLHREVSITLNVIVVTGALPLEILDIEDATDLDPTGRELSRSGRADDEDDDQDDS